VDDLPGGELSAEAAAALEAMLVNLGEARDTKLDGMCALVRHHELRAACRREEKDRLAKLEAADMNVAHHIRERLKEFFQRTGTKRVDTKRFCLRLQGNGGVQPINIEDEQAVPEEYTTTRMVVSIDREAVREALLAGRKVAGCTLLPRGVRMVIQ
jgi:hypothetical protein